MTIERHEYPVSRATITRIVELALSNFMPAKLFPDWDASVLADHPDWLPPEAIQQKRSVAPESTTLK
jgi:hypothetical protein